MRKFLVLCLTTLFCLNITFAATLTINTEFNNSKTIGRIGQLNWFIEPISGGKATDVSSYCLEGQTARSLTIPAKSPDGTPGTAKRTCTINDPTVLTENTYYTYAAFSYLEGETYYTYQSQRSRSYALTSPFSDTFKSTVRWLKDTIQGRTCDKNDVACLDGYFCYLTDPATTKFNTVEKMKPQVTGNTEFGYVNPDQMDRGCLKSSSKELFMSCSSITDQTACQSSRNKCFWINEKCYANAPLNIKSAESETDIESETRKYLVELESANSGLRKSAAYNLGEIWKGSESVPAVVIDALEFAAIMDHDYNVQKEASLALSKMGHESEDYYDGKDKNAMTQADLENMKSANPDDRMAVGELGSIWSGAGKSAPKEVTTALVDSLSADTAAVVRSESASSLGEIWYGAGKSAPKEITTALLESLDDNEGDVKYASKFALGEVWYHAGTSTPEEVTTALINALSDSDVDERSAALEALGNIWYGTGIQASERVISAIDALIKSDTDFEFVSPSDTRKLIKGEMVEDELDEYMKNTIKAYAEKYGMTESEAKYALYSSGSSPKVSLKLSAYEDNGEDSTDNDGGVWAYVDNGYINDKSTKAQCAPCYIAWGDEIGEPYGFDNSYVDSLSKKLFHAYTTPGKYEVSYKCRCLLDELSSKASIDILWIGPTYEPERWKDQYIRKNNNCYSYSVGEETKKQTLPGAAHNKAVIVPPEPYKNLADPTRNQRLCEEYIQASEADGLVYMGTDNYRCTGSSHAVALVMDLTGEKEDRDFHWYRRDNTGYWSHKYGDHEVTNLDTDGNLIKDPKFAARAFGKIKADKQFYGYIHDTFCGYFCVDLNKVHISGD